MNTTTKKNIDWRDSFIAALIILSFLGLFFIKPISQNLAYHLFADERSALGINNFLDVASNIPFLFIGLLGLITIRKNWGISNSWSWLILFLAIFLVSFSSAYYHLNPENKTLTWDRLPIAIGFMALFVITLSDYVDKRLEKWLLIPMCLLGIFSVLYWHVTDDLRIYAWVQFVTMGLILIIILTYNPTHLRTKYLLYAFLFYIVSKIFEYYDHEVFNLTAKMVSGHSIKHILAAIATFCFYLLLTRRKDSSTG